MSAVKKLRIIAYLFLVLAMLLTACGQNGSFGSKTDFLVSAFLPQSRVSQGHRLELRLTLENRGRYNIEPQEILLPASFVQGLSFVASKPALDRKLSANGDLLFVFTQSIAPQGVVELLFSFDTLASGKYAGTGELQSSKKTYTFALDLEVVGVNPLGWRPGAAKKSESQHEQEPDAFSVVKIDALAELNGREETVWSGSGAIINPDGLILTSADLVFSDRFHQVQRLLISLTVDENTAPVPTYYAGIVQADADLGIAVLKVHSTLEGNALDYALLNLPVIRLGESEQIELGTELKVLGYPKTDDENLKQLSIVVNDYGSEFPFGEQVLIHGKQAILPGFVGGPVLNEEGQLVAVPIFKSPVTFNPETSACSPTMDGNRSGRIDNADPCERRALPIDTYRPLRLAMPMIEAARRGEVRIVAETQSRLFFKNPYKLVFEDDFSVINKAWSLHDNETGKSKIEDNHQMIEISQPQSLVWSALDYIYDDVMIETEAHILQHNGNADFGVVCGMNNDDMTVFGLSENGFYAIWTIKAGKMRYLQPWKYASVIQNTEVLNIAVRCSAKGHELAVNGQLLASVLDESFERGRVGLYAGTTQTPGFIVTFDSFKLFLEE